MWLFITGILAFGLVLCLTCAAAPGFMVLLFLLPVFWAERLPTWDEQLKAWLETP